jgi:hypothetical protein
VDRGLHAPVVDAVHCEDAVAVVEQSRAHFTRAITGAL